MIKLDSRFKTLALYASNVPLINYLKPSVFTAYLGTEKIPSYMVKDTKKTIWIDLTQPEDNILMDFKSNTRNEVRKAIREGFIIEEVKDIGTFVKFYNAFAKEKGLGEIYNHTILKYPKILIYQSSINGKTLTMHASILDENRKIVRLLYSASVRFDTGIDRKAVGLSNRYLHYAEFIEFKKMGYNIYDFGGINEDESNKEQYNITIFKKGFGGVVKDEIHMKSILAWILIKLSILFSFRRVH